MNDLIKVEEKHGNFMTVKEIAEAMGISTDLVKKRIRELFPDKMVK